MGRAAAGVRAIRLVGNDKVVSAIVVSSDHSILTVTENGYGKRSAIDEFRIQKRGRQRCFWKSRPAKGMVM